MRLRLGKGRHGFDWASGESASKVVNMLLAVGADPLARHISPLMRNLESFFEFPHDMRAGNPNV